MEGQVPVLLLGVWTQQVSDGKRELGLQFNLQVVLGSRARFLCQEYFCPQITETGQRWLNQRGLYFYLQEFCRRKVQALAWSNDDKVNVFEILLAFFSL